MRRRKLFWIIPAAIIGMAVFIWIGGELVMHLWNWLLPALFKWPQITFWQAVALLALCRILFGGLGIRGGRGSHMRGRMGERMRWRMQERWEQMTPEEREKARQRWGRCGPFEPPDAKPTI
jgi:hypothetical protein